MAEESFVSLAERIVAQARSRPQRRAVVCDGEALTYGELVTKASRLAARLQALGLNPGDDRRVAVISSNCLDYAVVIVAGQLSGVAVAPISGLITPDAQARMLEDSNAVMVFHDRDHAEKAMAAVALAGNGAARTLVEIGPTGAAADVGSRSLLDQWLGGGPAEFMPVQIDPAWLSDLIYSSGTTGIPKGIVQPYAIRVAGSISLAAMGVPGDSCIVQTVSLYSNYGLASLHYALWWGDTFFITRKFSGAALVALLVGEPIAMVWFAPATLIRTMEAPGFEAAARGRPCTKICMGAPLSKEHKQQALAAWPGPFIEGYGQTETGTLSLLFAHTAPECKLGSVGTIVKTATVRIIDDDGNVLPVGAEGEIAAHTTTMMPGYHGRADANATAYWYDEQGRRHVRTGDVGKLDADGYLWLCDRKKDLIISGGFNIYPADIERVFQGHPAVFEVSVVGCASARWGETPVAFLTLRQGMTASEDELRTWVNARLGKVQRVAAVRILSALPDGVMGKILKRVLRDQFASTMGTLP